MWTKQKIKCPLCRYEHVYWDGDGSVTPLSVVFGTVYSLQQLSLSLLNVTLGQVRTNQHTAWGHVTTCSSLIGQVSTVEMDQMDRAG